MTKSEIRTIIETNLNPINIEEWYECYEKISYFEHNFAGGVFSGLSDDGELFDWAYEEFDNACEALYNRIHG